MRLTQDNRGALVRPFAKLFRRHHKVYPFPIPQAECVDFYYSMMAPDLVKGVHLIEQYPAYAGEVLQYVRQVTLYLPDYEDRNYRRFTLQFSDKVVNPINWSDRMYVPGDHPSYDVIFNWFNEAAALKKRAFAARHNAEIIIESATTVGQVKRAWPTIAHYINDSEMLDALANAKRASRMPKACPEPHIIEDMDTVFAMLAMVNPETSHYAEVD